MENELKTLRFDKLKALQSEIESFDFKCPSCKSEDIIIKPIGIPYKPSNLNNKDLRENNEKETKRLDELPTLSEAIRKAKKEDLICTCNECFACNSILKQIDELSLTRWLKKVTKEDETFLGSLYL